MKTLELSALVELSERLGMGDAVIRSHLKRIEQAMAGLAEECASALGVRHEMTCLDEAGLCSSFTATREGQRCPKVLHEFDPQGSFAPVKP